MSVFLYLPRNNLQLTGKSSIVVQCLNVYCLALKWHGSILIFAWSDLSPPLTPLNVFYDELK